uniref:Uncharacterized protein n=1 Tax=Biomphalaria glabrata TaxID=6526 RepID=A0A2C9LL91_BIOGL
MDAPLLDRLTRHRNMQLQRQLDVKLQILDEEYRLIKQDQEKHDEEMSQFCECLKHTAPGLNGYRQPNTKAMSIKNPTLLRKLVKWESSASKGKRKSLSSCETHGSNPWKVSQGSLQNSETRSRSSGDSTSRNSFFNKKIVLDARRRSFITKEINSNRRVSLAESGQNDIQSMFSKVNTLVSVVATASPRFMKSLKPKYGREAFSAQERSLRNNVLNKFNDIFTKNKHVETQLLSASLPVTKISPVSAKAGSFFELTELASEQDSNDDVHTTGDAVSRQHVAMASSHQGGVGQSCSVAHSARTLTLKRPLLSPDEAELRRRLLRERPDSIHVSDSRHKHRAMTAPANFELKQRAVVATRQQLVGILAEIEWRKAGLRALLTKSNQLRHTIRTLTPFQLDDPESLSD